MWYESTRDECGKNQRGTNVVRINEGQMWYESTRDECDTNRDDGVVWKAYIVICSTLYLLFQVQTHVFITA